MSSARPVTDSTFAAEVLASSKPILVDFWAEWCGPCRAVGPILDQILAEHGDKIDIVKLNVDENPQTAMEYQITSIPAMTVKWSRRLSGRSPSLRSRPTSPRSSPNSRVVNPCPLGRSTQGICARRSPDSINR